MAVLAPYSLNFPKADATAEILLTWLVGGDLQYAFEIEIYVNDGSTTPFYSVGRTPSYTSQAKLPANTLINGVEYKWRVRTYNATNQVGPWSDYSLIRASSWPVPTIANVSGTIHAQNYRFEGVYSQPENVPIKSYYFRLYQGGRIIRESPVTYSQEISATFSLESDQEYEVDLVVVSQYDITGISPKYPFDTSYQKPGASTGIVAQNLRDQGAVRIQWQNPTVITLPTAKEPQFVPGVYDRALNLADGNEVSYRASFSGQSTVMFWVIPAQDSVDFGGEITRLASSGGGYVAVGYDNPTQKFYAVVKNGAQTLVRGSTVKSFSVGDHVFLAVTQQDCYVGIGGVIERF